MTERLNFNGIVQGIGFRPAAQRIALELGVNGYVKNSGGNVELVIDGNRQALDEFVRRLIALFEIKGYTRKAVDKPLTANKGFKIIESQNDNQTPFITPDLATCADCEKELRDKNNRRYRHPFISCVNCGPRYTIINSLPYDRERITMSGFELCDNCHREYTTASDRRCHAQTIACNDCGPKTNITVKAAAEMLKSSEVVAIKGIGGYHLACRADDENAVKKIRSIKNRESKPFAVMFSSIEQIKEYCFVNDKEEELLLSPARPIVILEKKRSFPYEVCRDSDYTGAFLPCNPIQIMLLDEISPLVMTSANLSSSPIITDDEKIKDFGVPVLSHDREILTPIDDSVLFVNNGRAQFIRRARGYVPLAIEIDKKAKTDTLCMGGDLKSSFAYHRDGYVFLSQYFGDLEDADVFEEYKKGIKRFVRLHGFDAKKTVADMHPTYYSSGIYKNDILIQHHKAHIASVIAEHRLKGDVLGFAFDGTGYGDDGAVWGSEVLFFGKGGIRRLNHLDYTKFIAGDEALKNADLALSCYIGGNELVEKALNASVNTVLTSSMGRLFDAVSALLDICHFNSYEGECAIKLESFAKRAKRACVITPSLNPKQILNEIKDKKSAFSSEELALGFHNMISELICRLCEKYRESLGVNQIALSGGVFNNRIIVKAVFSLLEEKGFKVYINEKVPVGDGGIALGQAYLSATEE